MDTYTKERIAFHGATLDEIFSDIQVVNAFKDDPIGETMLLYEQLADQKTGPKDARISSYCSTIRVERAVRHLRVKPTDRVVELIMRRAVSDHDRFTFELTERPDGTVLVSAKSSAILQNIWITLLPNTKSLPAALFVQEGV